MFGKLFKQKASAPAAAPTKGWVQPEPPPPFPDAGAGARVTLWVEGWCSDSRKAERRCVALGWPTHREDLAGRHEEKVALFRAHHARKLPIVFVDGAYLGSWRELEALERLP